MIETLVFGAVWIFCCIWGVAVLNAINRIENKADINAYQIQRAISELHSSMREHYFPIEKGSNDDLSEGEFE